ncbi:MAG TPA: hypothetical protein VNS63_07945 [Blastocatellia bacterium]|nr:hypothetical protein [Blastocatellia bacterium]
MTAESAIELKCERALARLLRYCRSEGWAGYDPYDGLNSPLVRALTLNSKTLRTIATQLNKRSPVNLRPLLGIRKELNPKGLALAARALIELLSGQKKGTPASLVAGESGEELESDSRHLLSKLEEVRSDQYSEACWGYNFDWQSRAFFAPRGTPNVVCTVFAAHAFLDWYEATQDSRAFEMAGSSCRFLLDRINRTNDGDKFCFSYTPLDHSRVHNVNLLAAELLARIFASEGREEYRVAAEGALRFTIARQKEDGSWSYGDDRSQEWIDSFHTGFVLVSLRNISAYLGLTDLQTSVEAGYEFYSNRFFLADSTPGYYHDDLYPVDVHSAAQAIITFVEMTDLTPNARQRADRAAAWAIDNLQDSAGFFHFQRRRFYTIKIPYMRWSQAWMLYALSRFYTRDQARNV